MDTKPVLNIKSLKEQVYQYLREKMRTGELMPGSVIDMEETSKKLGVSKTPLRDALLQLETEDFVTILPRRKVVVNSLSLDEIRNYYEIIGALESTAVLSAVPRFGDEDIQLMDKLNDGMRRAIEANDFDLYYERNLSFHDVYLRLCGNPNLAAIVTKLKRRLYEFPHRTGFVKEWEESSIGEHQHLVGLIRQKKRTEAAAYVRDIHWSFKVQEGFISKYYVDSV